MEENDLLFDKTLRKIEFLFRYTGLNIRSGEQKRSNLWSKCLYIINIIWVESVVAGAISWFIDGVRIGKDFLSLTYIAPCISFGTIANLKGIFLMLNEKHVHNLIDNLRKLEAIEKERKQSKVKEDIAEKESKFLNYVLGTTTMLYEIVNVAFALSPILTMALKYQQTKELEVILPYLVLYPFDTNQIKIWPFLYLQQLWAGFGGSLLQCAADFFFFSCCTYLRIQFRLLQHDVENIIPVQEHPNRKVCEDEDFRREFKEIIMRHQDLIQSANILEIIYSKLILLNFVSSSIIICLTGFNVTMQNNAAFIISFLCFLFMSLAQVFFVCFFADLLTASSVEVSNAAYKTQWYVAEHKIGKKMLLVLTRSQKPCKLTASGFADVNLNAFMRVLSTSWSYFALLKTMYGN